MGRPNLLPVRLSPLIIFSVILTSIPQAFSILQCSSYAITISTQYIDYDPFNPSSTTVSCIITLSNSRSIGAAAVLIDSFDIFFENFKSGYSLSIGSDALEFDKTVQVTEPVSLFVTRIVPDTWDIYVETVHPRSSGEYTCNIGGCNSTSSIKIQYVPRILEPTFFLSLPPNSIDLYIKCPIQKTQYFLFICNANVTNCVPNTPQVSYDTPDSELFFAPPLTTTNLVGNTQENIQCLIVPVSSSFYRESNYVISTTQQPLGYTNISKDTGEDLNLSEYCQTFIQSINILIDRTQISFSDSNFQTIPKLINSLTAANTGLYYCHVQHEYFRVSMLIVDLIVQPPPTASPLVTSASTTTHTPQTTTTSTEVTPTTTIPYILQFPHYLYYLVTPGCGVIILILLVCLGICFCVICCVCCRKCCQGRSRKFSIDEISPPIPSRRDNSLSNQYVHLPELIELPFPTHNGYNFQNISQPFEGGFEESVLSEIPMLRPHKDQTLLTEEQAKVPKRSRPLSSSMPDIEKTPEKSRKQTPKHSSVNSPYDISSTQPPSQSVSTANFIPEPCNHGNQFLKPPVRHPRQRSKSAEAPQRSYGVLPSPSLPHPSPHPLRQACTVTYIPVANVSQPYMPTQPVALIQSQLPYRGSYTPNVQPQSPVFFPGDFTPSPLPSHRRTSSIPNQQLAVASVSNTPVTQTQPNNTTININIINQESLPPGHFVDFL